MSDDETITDRRKSEKLASAHAGESCSFLSSGLPSGWVSYKFHQCSGRG
jgi:hypothetical protein